MRSTSLALVVAAAAISGLAHGQPVTLVCGEGPGQPPTLTLEVDVFQGVVSYPMPKTPARISERRIEWTSPRQVFPSGEVRAAGSFWLDRVTGQFHRSFDCPSCTPSNLFCAPRQRMF